MSASLASSRPLFHNEQSTRQLQYAESLASQWQVAIQQCADPVARQLTVQLAPLLVAGLSELLKEAEREAQREAQHVEYMTANPAALPRPPFNAVSWLASYLFRNNPKHGAPDTAEVYQRYAEQLRSSLSASASSS